MTGPISRNRLLGSLKEAASWPGPGSAPHRPAMPRQPVLSQATQPPGRSPRPAATHPARQARRGQNVRAKRELKW
jgi:hypothetical protein